MTVSSVATGYDGISLLAGNSSYIPSSFESIQTFTVGSGGSSSISFTSIPSTYKHLQVRAFAQDNRATYGDDNMRLVINSDSGSNYAYHWMLGNGSSTAALATASAAYMLAGNTGTSVGGSFASSVIDILDYTNISKNKTIRYLTGVDLNGTVAGYGGNAKLGSGLWMSTSAITTLTFTPNDASNFTQYSSFALYGVK